MKNQLKPFCLALANILILSFSQVQAQTANAQPNSSSYNQTNESRLRFFNYFTQRRFDRPAEFLLWPARYKPEAKSSALSLSPANNLLAVVSSLNGKTGDLTLQPGANITITPGTNSLTIAATGLLSFVSVNTTLTGNGTTGSPLGIANGGVSTIQLADQAVTAPKLNTPNTPTVGQVLAWSGRGMFWQTPAASISSVAHDGTLTGDGSGGAPLGLAIPLALTGSGISSDLTLLTVVNSGFGNAFSARGGNHSMFKAGTGVVGRGGDGVGGGIGGTGVVALGGEGVFGGGTFMPGYPGDGLHATGGEGVANYQSGGRGAVITGGDHNVVHGTGGEGAVINGGNVNGSSSQGGAGAVIKGGSVNWISGSGGHGLIAEGGDGKYPCPNPNDIVCPPNTPPNHAGNGITAIAGQDFFGAKSGKAGEFIGNVEISGNLNVTGGTKNFRIDHPLDPANKYLIHAAIESSEVLNVYSGNIRTDECGAATVTLPDWFGAINADLRYQLTVIGTFAQAIVAEKVKDNRFLIKTTLPNVEVSWQVTGVRADAAMKKNPFQVEQDKPAGERGHYFSPSAFDQPEEKSIDWARHPELMKQRKERREAARQQPQQ